MPEYLHYYIKDMGYQNIVFYDSLRGFYNTCEEGYLKNFAKLAEISSIHGYIMLMEAEGYLFTIHILRAKRVTRFCEAGSYYLLLSKNLLGRI